MDSHSRLRWKIAVFPNRANIFILDLSGDAIDELKAPANQGDVRRRSLPTLLIVPQDHDPSVPTSQKRTRTEGSILSLEMFF